MAKVVCALVSLRKTTLNLYAATTIPTPQQEAVRLVVHMQHASG